MTALLRKCKQEDPDDPEYTFYCPGCKTSHWVKTTGERPRWSISGGLDSPTIRPSIVAGHVSGNKCHLFITNGQIQYLQDCHHDLAGQTIDMEAL